MNASNDLNVTDIHSSDDSHESHDSIDCQYSDISNSDLSREDQVKAVYMHLNISSLYVLERVAVSHLRDKLWWRRLLINASSIFFFSTNANVWWQSHIQREFVSFSWCSKLGGCWTSNIVSNQCWGTDPISSSSRTRQVDTVTVHVHVSGRHICYNIQFNIMRYLISNQCSSLSLRQKGLNGPTHVTMRHKQFCNFSKR